MRVTRSWGRKYFGSGCSSKISDKVHALSGLGDAVILAVEYLPLDVIPQLIKGAEDGSESLPLVVAEEALDVFEDEESGLADFEDAGDIEEESASCFIEPETLPSDTEGLAGKATNEKIELWKGIGVDVCCIAVVVMIEVLLVGCDGMLVDFGVPDALRGDAELLRGLLDAEFEAADTGEH